MPSKDDYRDKLRRFLRDKPELNRLLGAEEELDDDDLDLALESALDEFNSTPPASLRYDFEDFPSTSLLIHGAAIWALESAGILQSRNRLQYSDGGVSVAVSDKAGDYQSWIQNFTQKYLRRSRKLKRSINLEQCYGGVSSEYHDISQYIHAT